MPIRVKCPQCGSVVRVAEKYAGRRVKCPGCQGPIEVPDVRTPVPQPRTDAPEVTRPVDAPLAARSPSLLTATAHREVPPPSNLSGVAQSQPPALVDGLGLLKRAISGFLNLVAVALVVLSVLGFFFLRAHAPDSVAVALRGGWVFKEEAYYLGMATVVLFAIAGVGHLYRAYGSKQNSPKPATGETVATAIRRPLAKIAALVALIALLCSVLGGVAVWLNHKKPEVEAAQPAQAGPAQLPIPAVPQPAVAAPVPGGWPAPVRINQEKTSFLVTLTDAWYLSDPRAAGNKKTLCVALSYKNLGPREASFSLFGEQGQDESFRANDVEIKTDKGRIYPGTGWFTQGEPVWDSTALTALSMASTDQMPTRQISTAWSWRRTDKIDVAGTSALFFQIPDNERPVELICRSRFAALKPNDPGESWTLPNIAFPVRFYSEALGFLPANEEAVDGLVKALKDPEISVCIEAAKMLGRIGPTAKKAVAALVEAAHESTLHSKRDQDLKTVQPSGNVFQDVQEGMRGGPARRPSPHELVKAVRDAIKKIDPAELRRFEQGLQVRRRKEPERQAVAHTESLQRLGRAVQPREGEPKQEASVVWRDKQSSARFRIEENQDEINVKFLDGDRLLAGLSGTLTRTKPNATLFKGTFQATFGDDSKEHVIRATASLVSQDQLDVTFENWPRNSKGKKTATPQAVHRTLMRLHQTLQGSRESMPKRPSRTRSARRSP